MISISGIRGIIGEGLTPELLVNYSAAVGTFYGKGCVMVGRDSRITGEMVKHSVYSGLMSVGCNPVDLGICSTPTVQMAVKNSDAIGGIVITASHNPAEWNALKLLSSEGLFLDSEQGDTVKNIVTNEEYKFVPWNEIGQSDRYQKATVDHLEALFRIPMINSEKIRRCKFTVAYDCVNGAGGTILPQLFQTLGCNTLPINLEPNGLFAHTPEPVPQNLKGLCQTVRKDKADIGFAVDPDVDRCAIVSNTGEPIGEEVTIVLATKFILSKKKGSVVVNVSTTRAIDDIGQQFGVPVYRTPVGEIHVAKKMRDIGAVIGGEGNGGVILPELHLGRDAPVAIALVLQLLCETGESIEKLRNELPHYTITKKAINIGNHNPEEILTKIEQNHQNETINKIDGLKIEREKSWIHIRKSNTEPIIRIIAEASSQNKSKSLCNLYIKEIKEFIE